MFPILSFIENILRGLLFIASYIKKRLCYLYHVNSYLSTMFILESRKKILRLHLECHVNFFLQRALNLHHQSFKLR